MYIAVLLFCIKIYALSLVVFLFKLYTETTVVLTYLLPYSYLISR